MKKRFIIPALTALMVLGLAACGSKQTENVQTEAASAQAAAESQTSEENTEASSSAAETKVDVLSMLPEDFEEDYFEGIVTGIEGNVVTLKNGDGETRSFDMSGAERYDEGSFMEGCYAEVTYAVDAEKETPYALDINVTMDIEQQAAIENRDPVIAGTVQLCDINDLEIIDINGVEHVFDNSMARTVSFAPVKQGDKVYVYYCGSIFNDGEESEDEEKSIGTPIVIKIVTPDALGSEDAEANFLTGIVDRIDHENGLLDLLTESITFEVSGPEHMFKDIDEEDQIKVYYEGALSGIAVDAVKVEKE